MTYVASNNGRMCIYDTTLYIGDEVVKPKVEEKSAAKDTFDEAKKEGRTTFYGKQLGNGLVEFQLGNVPEGVLVAVEVKLCVVTNLSGRDSVYFKFPLEICTNSGRVQTMMQVLSGPFNFEFDCSYFKEKIRDVTSNSKSGNYDKATHKFTLREKNELDAIIVTMKLCESPKDDFIVSGHFLMLNLFGQDVNRLVSSPKQNNEFVFVVDCSGSMSGDRIKKASACLDLFLRSLPMGSYFNVVRFGSRFESLFPASVEYNDENVSKALEYASGLNANLGGTELLPVLKEIFSTGQKGTGQRQIFVLTDGEVCNTDSVLAKAEEHCQNNRIYTLGIGTGADPGLVEGLADVSGGRSDFVGNDEDQFSGKVIPQLESSISCGVNDLSVHVEGHDDVECSIVPLPSLTVNGDLHVVLRSGSPFNCDDAVLVNGRYGSESVDIPIVSSQSANDDCELSRLIEVWFSYQRIRSLEKRLRRCQGDDEKKEIRERIISLSKGSGILTNLTSFVGFSKIQYQPQPCFDVVMGAPMPFMACAMAAPGPMRQCACRRAAPPPPACRAPMGFAGRPMAAAAPPPPAPAAAPPQTSSFQFTTVTHLQNIRGYWEDVSSLSRFVGKFPEIPDGIRALQGVGADDQRRVFNTILAIAILRKHFMSDHSSWKMIEQKAISWLASVSAGCDWECFIQQVFPNL